MIRIIEGDMEDLKCEFFLFGLCFYMIFKDVMF